jgi:tRNA(Ile)-lysidine synthase TilS/MesJ/sulfur carrier protein ThiS
MPAVVFHSAGGQAETLTAAPGVTVRELLHIHGIPANAVLTWINGTVVAEQAAVGPDDRVEIRQVRHYDLDVTRRPSVRVLPSARPPVYAKSVLFDESGRLEVQTEQMDGGQFVDYVEHIFASSVTEHGLLATDTAAVVGLSGGRDSVAFLKLLERCADRIGRFPLTAVTVTGLPDWEEPATFGAARAAAEALGVEQVTVDENAIRETFQLRRSFHDVMQDVVGGKSRQLVMVITHHVMRRMVEIEGVRRGVGTVALGLNADDLFATIVTWLTSGFAMGGIPSRTIGSLRYVFPLFRITKKELTLYLELVAPDLNRQGTPGRFTTGPEERSMAYAITDHLYDLWPGIDYYVFAAYQSMTERLALPAHDECRICGAAYLPQPGEHNPKALCDVCHFFAMNEYAGPRG